MRTLALLLLSASVLAAQESAAISGQVVDPSGVPVPGVQVRVASQARSVTRLAVSDEQGIYIIGGLALGARRLNRAAFASPEGYAQGSLGRNSIHGFAMSQLDLSLPREVRLTESWRVHVAAQA